MNVHLAAAHRGLARVWIEFESSLGQVPVVSRLLAGRLRIEDYRSLLCNLRHHIAAGLFDRQMFARNQQHLHEIA